MKKKKAKNQDQHTRIVCVGKALSQAREFVRILHSAGFKTTADLQQKYDSYWQRRDPHRINSDKREKKPPSTTQLEKWGKYYF